MKPLRDVQEFSSGSERQLAQLLTTAERYKPDLIKKRRINVALSLGFERRSLRLWQSAAALGLLFAGTAAAATLGEQFWSEPQEQEQEQAQLPPQIPVARSTAPGGARAPARPAPPNKVPDPSPPAVAPPHLSEAKGRGPSTPPRRVAATIKKPPARAGEDPTRVVEALRALRTEQNPSRAQRLLSEYMQTNPEGALSEEALALSIEAAHARKDPAAKGYARRYLARYPGGRHRRLAERVLAE